MPAKRELTMRQLRYMLRLHHDGVSAREIGRTLGVARSTIQDNLRRAQASGIAWSVPAELTDDILEQRLFARRSCGLGSSKSAKRATSAAASRCRRLLPIGAQSIGATWIVSTHSRHFATQTSRPSSACSGEDARCALIANNLTGRNIKRT